MYNFQYQCQSRRSASPRKVAFLVAVGGAILDLIAYTTGGTLVGCSTADVVGKAISDLEGNARYCGLTVGTTTVGLTGLSPVLIWTPHPLFW